METNKDIIQHNFSERIATDNFTTEEVLILMRLAQIEALNEIEVLIDHRLRTRITRPSDMDAMFIEFKDQLD